MYSNDLFGKNYDAKPKLSVELEAERIKYENAIEGLPAEVRAIMNSYHIAEILINRSKDRELTNEEIELLNQRMNWVVSLSEGLKPEENHTKKSL